MCELTDKLRSYDQTSGYSKTMRKAADEIDALREKMSVENISSLIWDASHNEPGVSFDRADELAKAWVNYTWSLGKIKKP